MRVALFIAACLVVIIMSAAIHGIAGKRDSAEWQMLQLEGRVYDLENRVEALEKKWPSMATPPPQR